MPTTTTQQSINVGDGSSAQPAIPVAVQSNQSVLIQNQSGSSLNVLQAGRNGGVTQTLTSGQNYTTTVPVLLQSAGITSVLITTTTADSNAAVWRPIWQVHGAQFNTAVAGGTYIFGGGGSKVALAGAGSAFGTLQLDPADYAPNAVSVRLRVWVASNSTDPAAGAWTFALAPVATYNGGSNVDPGVATLGSNVVTAVVTPVASTQVFATGASAPFPPAGTYALTATFGSTTAVNSIERCSISLQGQLS
ncbi:hypothetical protein AYO39_02270 [Actinobacteria bacterium SCGC AG-212-D09]|nr:hypothetical protein AYO39_02270 [Actinobacteria bacterium SCGC AG-212-D09]